MITPAALAILPPDELDALWTRLNDECRAELAALNTKMAEKELVRRERDGRARKPVGV